MSELAGRLLAHERIAVVAHVSPDGDAIGSALAMRRALMDLGKEAVAVCQDYVPAMYDFLPGVETVVVPEALPFSPDCVLIVDVAAPDRAGTAFALTKVAKCTLLLDHHATNAGFADVQVIDGNASSTGELALELIDEMGVALDRDLATLLYAAISSDTGNFSFSYTTPAALRAVARCIEAGLQIDEASRHLFRLRSVARTRVIGAGISRMERVDGGRIAYSVLTRKLMDELGAASDDTEGLVNFFNEMEGVEVCFLATENGHGTKMSLRSSELVDVSLVAASMGGGGHARAAGVTLDMRPDEACALMIDVLRRELRAQ